MPTKVIKDEKEKRYFRFEPDQMGYRCEFEFEGEKHSVYVGDTAPVGKIFAIFDEVKGGAWATASFEGVQVTTRDLQWAAYWALACARHKDLYLHKQKTDKEMAVALVEFIDTPELKPLLDSLPESAKKTLEDLRKLVEEL